MYDSFTGSELELTQHLNTLINQENVVSVSLSSVVASSDKFTGFYYIRYKE